MKKKVLLTIIPALMVLTGCNPLSSYAAAGAKVNQFAEDTLAHEEVFGNGELGLRKAEPFRLDPINSAAPAIAVQTRSEKAGFISIRFVAAVKLKEADMANTSVVWTRTMYLADGTVKSGKEADEFESNKAYTKINDGGAELDISDFDTAQGNPGYTHFVVYTMRNIPDEASNYYLGVSLAVDDTVDNSFDAQSKMVVTTVNQNKQVSFPVNQEGYFLQGTIGGVAGSVLASVSPSGDDVARFSSALSANDAFYICYNHTDATLANCKFRVYDSSCIADENNPYFVDNGESSKMIKATTGHNYAFNFTGSYELDDIESGYTVQYTNNSEELVTVPLVYDGRDGSNKPQHTALISPKTGSALVFALDGNALTPSREDNANNNINNSRVVQCGGEDISLYVKDLGESHSLWVNYPGLKVFVNGNSVPLAPRANPHGNVAVYEVPLTAGQKVIVNRGYNQLHLGDTEDVEYTAAQTATYAFYINNEYKVYVDELTTVTFNVNYDTHNNGSLYALGNFSGDWEPWSEYRLTWSEGNNWIGELLLPVGKQLQLAVAPTENPTKSAVIAWQGKNVEITRNMSVTSW